jgi:hypothetical protein
VFALEGVSQDGDGGQSRVLSLFFLLAHKARHSVCGNPAFNSSAIHAIVIVIRRLNSLAS